MNFNIPTAMQMTATLTLLVAFVLAYAARQFPHAVQQPMRIWIRGLLLQCIPYFLYASREFAPEWISVVLADSLMVAALAVQMHALRRFNLQPDQRVHMRLIVVATIIFEVLLTYTWHSMRGRIVLVSLAIAAIACFGIDAIYRRRHVTRAEHMVGVLLFGGIVVMLLRAMIVPATSMLDVTMSSPMQGVVFTYAASMPVISTVAFVLMCGERINAHQSQQAMIDPLTGVYNRQAMAELANKAIALARLDGRPLALFSVDVDRFGRFNEDFGYDVGDQALCHVVDILRDMARPDDVMARVTGERFMLMLPETDGDAAFALACEMRRQIDQSGFASGGWPAPLQVSIGVAVLDEEKGGFEQLLRRADQSLNVAKHAGRNRVAFGDRVEVLAERVEPGAVNA